MKKIISLGIVIVFLMTITSATKISPTLTSLGFEIIVENKTYEEFWEDCIIVNANISEKLLNETIENASDLMIKENRYGKAVGERKRWWFKKSIEPIKRDKIQACFEFSVDVWIEKLTKNKITVFYCSNKPDKKRNCVSISGIRCYEETPGQSPWSNCVGGEWVTI